MRPFLLVRVGPPSERTAAGNIVPFVLWFNFIAGFAYFVAGCGVFLWKRWAAQLSAAIAIGTVAVFVAFGIYIFPGGAFEVRTIGAMTLRSIVWIAIAVGVCRAFECSRTRWTGRANRAKVGPPSPQSARRVRAFAFLIFAFPRIDKNLVDEK